MEGEIRSRFKSVCVFCGSHSGNRSVFSEAALELGHELVFSSRLLPLTSGDVLFVYFSEKFDCSGVNGLILEDGFRLSRRFDVGLLLLTSCLLSFELQVRRRINLVYGGGSVGLMGLISQTVYNGGFHVLGVIPTALMPLEISGETVGEVRTVTDMHERKAEMARQSDAFIALPGGYGTMEELLEMITWAQLGIHNKPVGLLNVDGYYDSLLALFDNGVEEGFINPTARSIIVSAPTAQELLTKMEQYTPSHEQIVPSKSWEISRLGYTS